MTEDGSLPLRVLHVVRPAAGGMRRHVSQLAARLPAHGVSVMIAAPRDFSLDVTIDQSPQVMRRIPIAAGPHPVHDLKAVDAVRTMRQHAVAAVEPTRQAQQAWNDDVQERMKSTVWSVGGCSSWYLDEHGRNVTLWPRTTYKFRQLTARFDTGSYIARPAATAAATRNEEKVSA